MMISIGNFLFKYRNLLFPLYVLALFLLFRPPACLVQGWKFTQNLVAVMISLSGLAVRSVVIGLAYIKRGGLNRKVYAANLVTEGMFSVCRNPLYVGNMLIYTGLFLMFGNDWCLLTGMVSFWLIYECIIAAEENFLRTKFGASYEEYCRDVPRWLPRFSKIGEATSGMKFDWKKVIFKDYSTMCSTLTFLLCVQIWDILANQGLPRHEVEVSALAGAMLFILLATLTIRAIKKSASRSTSGKGPGTAAAEPVSSPEPEA